MDFLGGRKIIWDKTFIWLALALSWYRNSPLPRCASESRHISVGDGADMSTNDAVDVYDTFLKLT